MNVLWDALLIPTANQKTQNWQAFGAELIQKWKNTKQSVPFVTLDSGVLAVSCAICAYF